MHKLVLDCFDGRVTGNALQARVQEVHLAVQAPDLGDSIPAQSIDVRHAAWKADLPLGEDDDRLWTGWTGSMRPAVRRCSLHCLSFGVNALYERPNPYSGMGISQHGLDRRPREADWLRRA